MKKLPVCAHDRLSYNHETGDFTWIYANKAHPRLYGAKAGTVRDYKNDTSRMIIKIDGIPFFAHRLAWFLYYKEQPNIIDHINGNSLDNRIVNLRNVTPNENAKNHGKKFGKSGLPCGVRLISSGKYQVRIRCDGKVYSLGTYRDLKIAEKIYLEKRNELFKQYARKAA